ncbi:MAG: GNAT family N-acetyltransferase [Nitrososphaerales archaeon]
MQTKKVTGEKVTLRRGSAKDAGECGRICYEAFKRISERHGFAPDMPSVEVATGLMSYLLEHPKYFSAIAEKENGQIVGSNFLDERAVIAGVGPITVDPDEQDSGIGRLLMQDVLARTEQAGFPGVRLVQAAYHGRSLSLYTKLGFITRETLSVLQGEPVRETLPGLLVREAVDIDVEDCNQICFTIHGFEREEELRGAISRKEALVVERGGHIRGYTTGLAFSGHSVAQTNEDLAAMIACGGKYGIPGFLVPTRNWELFDWCLERGLRVVEQMTLMTIGYTMSLEALIFLLSRFKADHRLVLPLEIL